MTTMDVIIWLITSIVGPILLESLSPLLALKKQAAMLGNPMWGRARNNLSVVPSHKQQVTEVLSPTTTRNLTGPTAYMSLKIDPFQ